MGFLDLLRQLTMYFDPPVSLDDADKLIKAGIEEFGEDSPRLYSVHKEYFRVVEEGANLLEDVFRRLWSKRPYGPMKSIYICWSNKLSRWTDICVRIRTRKVRGVGVGIDEVTVSKFYKPEKFATYLVRLREPSLEELRKQLEELE